MPRSPSVASPYSPNSRSGRPWAAVALGVRAAAAVVGLLLLALPLGAQELTPTGLWQTISDVDGKPEAYIRIREVQGEFVGFIEQIVHPDQPDARCEKCPGERHNQPILGLKILTGARRDGDRYTGGQILDPDSGKIYSCNLTLTDAGKRLQVRGFLGFSLFGRTQTWLREQ